MKYPKDFINKIICGDCLEVIKKIPDNSIDLVLTDPPYNLNKPFKNDNLIELAFLKFLIPIFNEMARVIKEKHSIIVFFDNGKKLPLFWKCLFKSKLIFQKGCTLYKPNDCSTPHNRILRTSEVFYVLSSTDVLHHDGDKYIHDCLIGNHEKKEKYYYHPTVKNIKIIKEIILSHSCKNDIVLDPFLGSGTTAVACKELNRKYIGIEQSKEYCKISEQRIKKTNIIEGALNRWIK